MLIYKIYNKITKKIYIGQTTRTLEERMKEHFKGKVQYIDRVLRKYGEDNFDVSVIDYADTVEELNEKEVFWIEKSDSIKPYGYNLCEGGGNTKGYNHKDESKKKMSKAQLARDMGGTGNPFYGKKHTEETKKKMREAWSKRSDKKERMAKLTESSLETHRRKVINLDTGEIFNSLTEAAESCGSKTTHVSRVCRGGRKRTGGYRWSYYDEYTAIPCQA